MFQFNEGDTVRIVAANSSLKGSRGIVIKSNEHSTSVKIPNTPYPLLFTNFEIQRTFSDAEKAENIEDFKNLIPMRIVMKPEEFEWLKSKIDAEDSANIPNLKALSEHPPKGAI